ncbi:hypothetical protein [Ruminococcus sp.]|uniref:hypothetical protein n=1 Tax=Ruminococcus sp. TaxID=41978 RepID=UPI002C0021B9|nr:hypothetical protein [Ruminococcus sp.]HNZ97995.1 hypothetical protein [Ruminococcus sp.]HOH86562.1 hypothetical protein [Ruminococcus sp.]
MLIKGSRRYNLRHNESIDRQLPFGEMINGQGRGIVAQFRYGICHMSFNGCEVIAVHNALVYLKKPRPLKDIAFYMERFRVLLGFFGCNAYRIGKALKHFGVEFERSKYPDDARSYIITYWTKKPFLSTIHTVFCIRQDNGILVYNSYNTCIREELCRDLEEVAGKRRPIAVYKIIGSGEISPDQLP